MKGNVVLHRILDFRRAPPVAGRWFNLTSDIYDLADSGLRKTFFRSPGKLGHKVNGKLIYFKDKSHYFVVIYPLFTRQFLVGTLLISEQIPTQMRYFKS